MEYEGDLKGAETVAREIIRAAVDVARHGVGAAELAFVLVLELAGDRRQRRVDVGHPRHDRGFAGQQGAALGIRDDVLEPREGQALAHA